jgi:hypothetical protein
VASRFNLFKTVTDTFVRNRATLWVAKTADMIEGEARRIAPVRKPTENGRSGGRLRASIGTKMSVSTHKVTARVGSRVNYALAAHQGARPHVIRARRKQFLSFKWNKAAGYGIPVTRRGKVQLKKVNHPGMDGSQYLVRPLVLTGRRRGFRVTFVRAVR